VLYGACDLDLLRRVAVAFVLRQQRAATPLYDPHIARRRVFWVAAVGGLIVFGSLMGALFTRSAVHAERARLFHI
jgi:hypothetical protein